MGDIYTRAGILDQGEFYRTKFVSDETLDARYFKALDRFDIRFARTMWIYDNVRAYSTVLDLGCGAGMLALLKRKGVTLTGVDLSVECAHAAKRNGYDITFSAQLIRLPFDDATFDYVVSLDVLGHIDFQDKDKVLAEIKRVLRPEGVTMHGIESIDRQVQKPYDKMTPDELRRFVEVDGHVGLEEEHEHAARFGRFFKNVAWEPRYALCLSCEEFLKQADQYGLKFETDFLDYLRSLTFKERRAFDMAMGYVFSKVSDLNIHLPPEGLYVLLKASDAPLESFYNAHRDRGALLSPLTKNVGQVGCLDRNNSAVFDDGWYEPEMLPPVARWMSKRGQVSFKATSLTQVSFDLTTHIPDLHTRPLGVEVSLNGVKLCAFSMFGYSWLDVRVPVPEELSANTDDFVLQISADRTWQPRPTEEPRDDRELSIAVCNIEIFP
jgi:ubiquinone/menaquinone biosynthesis C-methylase UbiE